MLTDITKVSIFFNFSSSLNNSLTSDILFIVFSNRVLLLRDLNL